MCYGLDCSCKNLLLVTFKYGSIVSLVGNIQIYQNIQYQLLQWHHKFQPTWGKNIIQSYLRFGLKRPFNGQRYCISINSSSPSFKTSAWSLPHTLKDSLTQRNINLDTNYRISNSWNTNIEVRRLMQHRKKCYCIINHIVNILRYKVNVNIRWFVQMHPTVNIR